MGRDDKKSIGKALDDATEIKDTGKHDPNKVAKQMGTAKEHGPNQHKNPDGHIGKKMSGG